MLYYCLFQGKLLCHSQFCSSSRWVPLEGGICSWEASSFFRSGPQFRGDKLSGLADGKSQKLFPCRMVEKLHVRPTCFVLLSAQGQQLCSYKLNLYMLYLLCFVMSVHISCPFFLLALLIWREKRNHHHPKIHTGRTIEAFTCRKTVKIHF